MYFNNITECGLPIDYYILDLEFGSTRSENSEQNVPLEIALTQYHKGQQKHKSFLKYCYSPKYDDHTLLRALRHSNFSFEKYINQGKFDNVINDFLEYFDPTFPVGGWNVKGDLKVLNYFLNHHRNNNKFLNTCVSYFNVDEYMRILSDLKGLKLEQAGRIYGYDTSKMHHALNDVRLTHAVYENIRKISEQNEQIKAQFKSKKLISCDLRIKTSENPNNITVEDKVVLPLNKETKNVINGNKMLLNHPKVTIKELNKYSLNNSAKRIRSKKQLSYTFIGTSSSILATHKKQIMSSLSGCLNKNLICRDTVKQTDFAVYIDDTKHWEKLNNENLFTPKENNVLNKNIPIISLEDLQFLSCYEIQSI